MRLCAAGQVLPAGVRSVRVCAECVDVGAGRCVHVWTLFWGSVRRSCIGAAGSAGSEVKASAQTRPPPPRLYPLPPQPIALYKPSPAAPLAASIRPCICYTAPLHSWPLPPAAGDLKAIAQSILVYAYYWYNFMPLARGTAACGYTTVLSLFWAAGMPVTSQIPKEYQVGGCCAGMQA